jgi:drug/metabolite transporter (DMT)-like permease
MHPHPHPHFPKPRPALILGLVFIVIIFWSLNYPVVKLALPYLPAPALASMRVVVAAATMLAIGVAWRAKQGSSAPAAKIDRADWPRLAVMGLFGVAGNQMLFTIGLGYTSVGHSALIVGGGPITVLLLARLMRLELLTISKLAGMLLCFSGVGLLALEKGIDLHSGTFRGDLITWAGSFSFSLYTVLGKRLSARYDSLTMNVPTYIAGGLVALPVALWQGGRMHWQIAWQGWAAILYMAIFSSVLAYLVYFWALRHMAASRLAAFLYIQPVLGTLLGVVVLHEPLTGHLLGAAALVLGGVYLAERAPRAGI